MFGAERDMDNSSFGTAAGPQRLLATPLARKLARERKLNLAHVRGSGPRGRIIAADVRPAPEWDSSDNQSDQLAALGIGLKLDSVEGMLKIFSTAGLSIDFEDVMIRAASAVLSALNEPRGDVGNSVHFELADGMLGFPGGSTMSLSAIHKSRLEHLNADRNGVTYLSIRVVNSGGLTPVLMPPLPGFAMRLVISAAAQNAEASATLFFNQGRITAEYAISILTSLQQRVELPILLLL